jgi:hypothetical protein
MEKTKSKVGWFDRFIDWCEKKIKEWRGVVLEWLDTQDYTGTARDYKRGMGTSGVVKLPVYDEGGNKLEDEFEVSDHVCKLLSKEGLRVGRMVGPSKTLYHQDCPNNVVAYNSNLLLEGHGKVWYGDIDVTKSKSCLQKVANQLRQSLYILREHDCRFGSEENSDKWDANQLKDLAVAVIIPD